MKILLAEDHEDTAMVYKAALGDNDHVGYILQMVKIVSKYIITSSK
jgi:hypothetical protein